MDTMSRIAALMENDPYIRQFGITISHMAKGQIDLSLQIKESMMRIGNIVHGGVIAGLMDIAGSLCIFTHEGIANGFTINLSINYLSMLQGHILSIHASTEREGKGHLFISMYMEDERNQKVASATGVWKVMRS